MLHKTEVEYFAFPTSGKLPSTIVYHNKNEMKYTENLIKVFLKGYTVDLHVFNRVQFHLNHWTTKWSLKNANLYKPKKSII